MSLIAILLLLFAASPGGVTGNWKTPGGSIVHIYSCGSELCAKLVEVSSSIPEKTDEKNPDPAKRRQPLCGLVIAQGFKSEGASRADGGHIYDPKIGKTFSGTMQANGDELQLHGYIGISLFGRTETWHRTEQIVPPCPR